MNLTAAGQAEILRAAQRDEGFKESLGENASELIRLLCGFPGWIRYRERVKLASRIAYDCLTTMLNLQTLGEEFTGIIQVNRSGTSLPNKFFQFLSILLSNCGKTIFSFDLQGCEDKIEDLPEYHPLRHSAMLTFIRLLNCLRTLYPLLDKCHKVLFYFNGEYYEMTKKLFGIRYVLVRYWLKNNYSALTFRLLGIVSLISASIEISHFLLLQYQKIGSYIFFGHMFSKKRSLQIKKTLNESVKPSEKCPLCLNARQDSSVTPCGHLFCWSCIISWLQEQPKCPICRQTVQPSRVVFLQNYSIEN